MTAYFLFSIFIDANKCLGLVSREDVIDTRMRNRIFPGIESVF
jgi:hypothetical protein